METLRVGLSYYIAVLLFSAVALLSSCERADDPIETNQDQNTDGGNDAFENIDAEEYLVSDIPSQCSIWNGHLVTVVTEYSDTQATGMLLSLTEQSNMYSALNADNDSTAIKFSENYSEGNIKNWSIPNTDEAKSLKSLLTDSQIQLFNEIIKSAGGAEIKIYNSSGDKARYLCENATKTFSFAPSSNISQAGKTSNNYYLRLIKVVKFVKAGAVTIL